MGCRVLSVFTVTLCLAGCAATNLPPLTDRNTQLQDDEQRLWKRCEEGQERLARSGLLFTDPELDSYLEGVIRRLQSNDPDASIAFEVHVIRSPYLNAFAYANGVIYIHTGMLATLENEAQLAAVLAHEMTHATHRHAVREFRDTKNKAAFFATAHATLGGVAYVGDLTYLLGAVGTRAAIAGYSRELEREADAVGYARVVDAGYDAGEAVKFFDHLEKELKMEGRKEPFFFGTHPRVRERRENFESLHSRRGPGVKPGEKNAERYLLALREVVIENAFANLALGRFDLAEEDVEKYTEIGGEDARACFVRGELCRQRSDRCAVENAVEHYKRCLAYDPLYAEAYKKLGWIYHEKGEDQVAKGFLEEYLRVWPEAPDKAFVQQSLEQIEKGGAR